MAVVWQMTVKENDSTVALRERERAQYACAVLQRERHSGRKPARSNDGGEAHVLPPSLRAPFTSDTSSLM